MEESANSAGSNDLEKEEVLDRMLTRLALTDDPKLETVLPKILPYSISSLSSGSPAIRKKVMEILTHLNKRVKHQKSIRLPVMELWKEYVEVGAALIVRNFCMIYIEMAFDRLTAEEKADMAPMLIANISKFPSQHQDILLRIVMKVIGECHKCQIEESIALKYKLGSDDDRGLFVEFCLLTVLYQPTSPSSGGEGTSPGLSVAQTNQVTGKLPLKGDEILSRKLGILNVIEALNLDPQLIYPLYLAASADSQELVIKRGEELLKKLASRVNLEDPKLINKLFLLLTVAGGSTPPESRINPVNPTFRLRLLSIFCRSITAANTFPLTLQCIFNCIFGSDSTSKLKQLGMEFTVWVFKHAVFDQLKLMGPVILSGITKFVDAHAASGSETSFREMKSFAFQAVGLLSHRMPELFREKGEMAVRLFDALKAEDQSLRLTIQDALNALSLAYKGAPVSVLKDLEMLILQNSQAVQSEARFCAMRWATSLFDLQHCPSRFICMLGASDEKLDVRELALEGLHLTKDYDQDSNSESDFKYPKLNDMLNYTCSQQPKVLGSPDTREGGLLFPAKTYVAMIRFLLKLFNVDYHRTLSTGDTSEFCSSFNTMFLLLEHALVYEGSVELHAIATKGLVTIGSRFPQIIASRYAGRITWLRQFLGHISAETRECVSRLMGIACSELSSSETSALISDLCSHLKGTELRRFESFHGEICALGYVVAQCRTGRPDVAEPLIVNSVEVLAELVKSESLTLAAVAMEALGHIGLRGPLPLLFCDSNNAAVLTTLNERLSKLLCGDEVKAVQKIVISLGHVSYKETSLSLLNLALDLIFVLCRSKVEDVLFAAGEALSFIWGGVPITADKILKSDYISLSFSSNYLTGDMPSFSSKIDMNSMGIDDEDTRILVRDNVCKKLFDGLLYSSRKEERCAGTIWLLSLTMYCGHHPKIQDLLPEIQEAFSYLLGDTNELTQDLASQGMSIVYEIGNSAMKRDLVNALVGTLAGTSKRKKAIKLTEDSEVFQEGTISQSPSGGKLSTYKELCNMANEMGQPDLIYKFMDLANYQASLNSKRGAAFGFSKIAKQAGEVLQPFVRLLVPRLVRYQYDPDKNVQDAMGHIWKFLVADPKKAVDEHFDDIVDDLLIQSGSRLWRSREASCLALADIIQGRKFSQVSNYLRKIWTAAFRTMDDIKETVRNAGERLCRSLSSLTIRLCDVSLTEKADAISAMEIVLPFLLREGIMSKVVNIQKLSIDMVMKLSKGAGDVIRPHLPDLVSCMLESLSSLEDQRLNYIELHSVNIGIQSEKLENLRVAVAKDSAMWETLDVCLKVIDVQSLDHLVPRLAQLVRSGVGLNTRVGVASFTSLLIQKIGDGIKPFTNLLSKILFPATLAEKSGIAKRAFAGACASTLKYAVPSVAQQLIEDTTALHIGDKNSQLSCAILLKNYSHLASDVASGYHSVILPVVFVERFNDDKDVCNVFDELWEEISSSESVTLQLYLGEVVSLLCDFLTSTSWASKKKSAKAIQRLSDVLGESLSVSHQDLLKCLLQEMPGRLWEGKESILHAVAALSASCHKAMSAEDPSTPNTVIKAVSSACLKKSKSYRDAAYSSLQQVIKAFGSPDSVIVVLPMLLEACSDNKVAKHTIPSVSGSTAQGADGLEEERSLPVDKVIDCVAACISIADMKYVMEHRDGLVNVLLYAFSPSFPWTVKVSVLSAVRELFARFNSFPLSACESPSLELSSFVNESFHSLNVRVIECIKIVKIAQVHVAASECLLDMIKVFQAVSGRQVEEKFKDELLYLLDVEKNEVAKSLLKQCIESCCGIYVENS
ncbi:uncharacterized protein LOC116248548 isoform X2 [Nymphaea colorata]|uniref:uncharacterized protein LOC116248548 isoform X2 n=1 Tax=Nymphaea colorata TaxID=210225 RepID=UPI00129E40FB|nr:uncharacterized protein LOC116248548 isoform X2 [Nymphaea colorata]